MTILDLPAVNGALNGLSAVFLSLGYYFIRRKNQVAHRNCMIAAFVTSVIFLICYITYHTYLGAVLHRGPTVFREPAWFRPIYLAILISHTLLAVVIVPLVLMTLYRAAKKQFERHRKLARWTWPLWMYVSVTGVLIYGNLYAHNNERHPLVKGGGQCAVINNVFVNPGRAPFGADPESSLMRCSGFVASRRPGMTISNFADVTSTRDVRQQKECRCPKTVCVL